MNEINKDERALLVVANLGTHGDPNYQKLYDWIDINVIKLADKILSDQYRIFESLSEDEVLSKNFVDLLKRLAADLNIKAIDVILSLHGLEGKLCFDDGRLSSKEIGTSLKGAGLENKLRLLYSGACYGETHAKDFLNAGFQVASGAVAVAANGFFDFPLQMYNWRAGKPYRTVLEAGNIQFGIDISDTFARAIGFKQVNSFKVAYGNTNATIHSNP